MQYQIPPQSPSSPNIVIEQIHTYDYSNQEEPFVYQQAPAKNGFKRRTIPQQSSGVGVNQEHTEDAWYHNPSTNSLQEGSPDSKALVVDVHERTGSLGISYQSPEDGSLQNLKFIISQAKQAENNLFSNDDINDNTEFDVGMQENGNQLDVGYSGAHDELNVLNSRIRKTSKQGVEIDFTEELDDRDLQQFSELESKSPVMNNDGLNHSKSSYISGNVRYSKMPEEEAATIFQQRRKELLENLVKKGRRKNLRIFQDQDAHAAARAMANPDQQSGNNKALTSFVVFNTRNPSLHRTRNMESPTHKIKPDTKDVALRKSVVSARNPKQKNSPLILNHDLKDSQVQSATVKGAISKPANLDRRDITKKDMPSSRALPKDVRNSKKEEAPNTVLVDWNTLKYGRNSKAKKLSGEHSDFFTNSIKQETRPYKSEIKQESEAVDTPVDKKSGLIKKRETWSEFDSSINQVQEYNNLLTYFLKVGRSDIVKTITTISDEKSDILYQPQDEVRKNKLRVSTSSANKRRSRDSIDINDSLSKEVREVQSQKLPSQNRLSWVKYEEKVENPASAPVDKRISDRYKIDDQDFLIEEEPLNVYSRNAPKEKMDKSNGFEDQLSNSREDASKQCSQSYRSLNDRKFGSQRGDYLYQKAIEQKELKQQQNEAYKRERELEELRECTFSPTFRARSIETLDDFNTRAKNWQMSKERKIHDIEKSNVEKELAECTFHPKTAAKKSEMSKFDADEFYQRNMEWKKKIEQEGSKKQEDLLKLLTLSAVNTTADRVKSTFSTTAPQKAMISSAAFHNARPSLKKDDTPLSGRSYSKKQQKTEEKKFNEPARIKVLTQSSEPSSSKTKSQKTQKLRIHTTESDFIGQERRSDSTKAHPNAVESTELFDLLRKAVSNKNDKSESYKSKGLIVSPYKNPKTTKAAVGQSKDEKQDSITLTTLGMSFPVTNKNKNNSNDVPFLLNDYTAKALKSNVDNVVIKNNKYYISRKVKSPSHSKNFPPEANSADKKSTIMSSIIPSQLRSKTDFDSNQTQQGYSSKMDQENKLLSKKAVNEGVKNHNETIPDLFGDIIFDQSEGERAPLAEKQENGNGDTKSLTEISNKNPAREVNLSLEKRFLDLISQVSRVTQQLDQIRPSVNSPTLETASAKRRRMNFSLY